MSDLAADAGVTEIAIKVPGIIYISSGSRQMKNLCCVLSLLWGGEISLVGGDRQKFCSAEVNFSFDGTFE